ncbi:MAG: EVE domain-containing protein [Gammaproteobacteria bacterium]|nr:EVE domain-containing protein [Gammaproteobacteria bacterium]
MKYWLMKSEPDAYGINDLIAQPARTDHWDGIRNYQARNFMSKEMKVGDQAFFYHSSCAEPGIVGIVKIAREAYLDFTAFDSKSKYYDPKSTPEKPRWFMVDVKFVRKLKRPITLQELKAQEPLQEMRLLQRGNRLSILPVSKREWDYIVKLEKR